MNVAKETAEPRYRGNRCRRNFSAEVDGRTNRARAVGIPTSANKPGNTPSSDSTSTSASTNASMKGIGFDGPTTQSVFVVDERIARATIHNGSIDHIYIAQLEQAALAGTPDAGKKAAAAHEAAAAFEANKGNLDAAVEQEAQALRFVPDDVNLLMDVAFAHLRRSEYSLALKFLTRARSLAARIRLMLRSCWAGRNTD